MQVPDALPSPGELERRMQEAERLEEVGVTQFIPNLGAGANCGRSGTISASKGGASTEENEAHHRRKGPPERVLEGGSYKEASEVPAGDSGPP